MNKVWMVFWTWVDEITGDIERGALAQAFISSEIAELYALEFFINDATMEFYEEAYFDVPSNEEAYVIPSAEFPLYITELRVTETTRILFCRAASWKQETIAMSWQLRIQQVEVL